MKRWDKESALKEAKKYSSRVALYKNSLGCYKYLTKNHKKELDKILPYEKKRTQNRWTEEEALAAARKCKTRKEFNTIYKGAYNWLTVRNRQHLLDEMFPIDAINWDLKKVLKYAKTFKTRTDFVKKGRGAYTWIIKKKQGSKLDEIFPPIYKSWDKDAVLAAAKKCRTRDEFQKKYKSAWYFLKNKHPRLLDKVLPVKNTVWSIDKVMKLAQKFNNVQSFRDSEPNAYAYLSRNKKTSLLFDKYKQKRKNKPKKFDWDKKQVLKVLKSCKSRGEFQREFSGGYKWLKNNNLICLLDKYHPNTKGNWTDAKVIALMKKCSSRTEFRSKYSGACAWMYQNDKQHLIDIVFPKKICDRYLQKNLFSKVG